MFPYLDFGKKSIPMYSIFTLIGVCLALLYFKVRKKQYKLPEADAELLLVYCFIGVFLGAKFLFLLTVLPELMSELHYLSSEPVAFLEKYLYSGFVFYGGLYGALLSGWIYCHVCKLDFYAFIQDLFPLFPLIHAFGRIGCFCMGCCYGCPSKRFGIAFSHSPIAPNGIPLLPVQLIEAVAELILFFFLNRISKRNNSGIVMLYSWMFSYGILRLILESFRGDDYRGFLGPLSTSQILSLFTIVFGIVIYKKSKHRLHRTADAKETLS